MHLAFMHAPIYTLGPGSRIGIWLQGCSLGCNDCMSYKFQSHDQSAGYWLTVEELSQQILQSIKKHSCDGITFSGGEPFEQPEELHALTSKLYKSGVNDILIYTGMNGEEVIKHNPWVTSLVTCMIDGPFVKNKPTNAIWKGSDNQRYFLFKDNFKYDEWLRQSKGTLQVLNDGNHLHIIGIPRCDDLQKLLSIGKH